MSAVKYHRAHIIHTLTVAKCVCRRVVYFHLTRKDFPSAVVVGLLLVCCCNDTNAGCVCMVAVVRYIGVVVLGEGNY